MNTYFSSLLISIYKSYVYMKYTRWTNYFSATKNQTKLKRKQVKWAELATVRQEK